MRILILIFSIVVFHSSVQAQASLLITITDELKHPLPGANIYLTTADSVSIFSKVADSNGTSVFMQLVAGRYRIRATQIGFSDKTSEWINLQENNISLQLILTSTSNVLKEVTVISKKQFIQFLPDKTVINPEANITNAGATVMDVLEKSPGITVGKDGSIIMKGKPSVMVLIDGKPTQLGGAELQSYLSGMSASLIDVVELIENPGAKYDAAGNAGIINIKTKANRQRGFNGSLNLSIGQGVYAKTGNGFNLNYRNGKMNWFVNYSMRASNEFLEAWTLRTYFDSNQKDSALLEQPALNKSSQSGQNIKAGFDYFKSPKTTFGVVFTGGLFTKHTNYNSDIKWMDPFMHVDSVINTRGENNQYFKRRGLNINGRHKINEVSDINADIDYVRFNITNDQEYRTQLLSTGSQVYITTGEIPSRLNILTAKLDYSRRFKKLVLETGVKTAINKTDNLADYFFSDNGNLLPDLSRSNHFLYDEKISALYASADAEKGKWHWQGGLRYELTAYRANQLGNTVVPAASFKKNYGSLFPTAFVSYNADSNNVFTVRAGRRIDRPQFQYLNPFLRTLNKYTYEGGNPFIRPQYTWNFALAHTWKQKLTTEISYSDLRDYFSQVFIIDSNSSNVNRNIIIYTRSNVGSLKVFSITETLQQPLTRWWSLTAVAVYNHKLIEGVIWAPLSATIDQLNVSLNNQFKFNKGWGVEISGYYQTRSQIDLQEWLTPQGELNFGISKQLMKNKASLKLNVRDITYFQNYSGESTFENSIEPFWLKWDSRVVRLTFSWRFGKTMKAVNRSEGSAKDEIERAGG